MKNRNGKNNEPGRGWSKNEKMRLRIWEERGYGVSHLDESTVDVFAPNREDHHLTYISAPFSADMREKVEHYALKALEKRSVPVNPYLMYGTMFYEKDKRIQNWILLCSMMLLMHCDELWVIARTVEDLEGHVSMEMRLAQSMDIPIRLVSLEEEEEIDE